MYLDSRSIGGVRCGEDEVSYGFYVFLRSEGPFIATYNIIDMDIWKIRGMSGASGEVGKSKFHRNKC